MEIYKHPELRGWLWQRGPDRKTRSSMPSRLSCDPHVAHTWIRTSSLESYGWPARGRSAPLVIAAPTGLL